MGIAESDIPLTFSAYRTTVRSLKVGKRLPDAVYLHRSAITSVPEELLDLIAQIAPNELDEWNVIKFFRRDFRVSLLSYPGFFDDCYPQLHESRTFDLVRNTSRLVSYVDSKNPPILHRKETLIAESHPSYDVFKEITKEGEDAGLYESTNRIGFKKNWEKLISQKGYCLVDGRLRPFGADVPEPRAEDEIEIARHRTAIDRSQLSAPMAFLARVGYFDGSFSVFDYGCGKGHDILELEAHGVDVDGWDPAHRPDSKKRAADIVNLGFVINVIEDRSERVMVLKDAFDLSKKLLVVSVILGGESTTRRFKEYKDGVVTSRNTFQKYFGQSELKHFVESVLEQKALAAGPGVFCVFKDKLEEQEFLARRQRVQRQWKQLTERDRTAPAVDSQTIIDSNVELFKSFWICCLDFGRVPANDEFDRSDEVRRVIGSHRKAFVACSKYFDEVDFSSARDGRIEDIVTFLALSLFDRRESYSRMPRSLQRDIKAFFAKPSVANELAKQALFSVANTENIARACFDARERLGCGRLESDHSYVVTANTVANLPGILRIYVGCAMQLYGDLDGVDLVKIHMTSGKVSLMIYDDFRKPLPLLRQRVKIRLRDQEIDWFDYDGEYASQPLYLKSQYLSESALNFNAQQYFDIQMTNLRGIDLSDFGPSLVELEALLSANKKTLKQLEVCYDKALKRAEK